MCLRRLQLSIRVLRLHSLGSGVVKGLKFEVECGVEGLRFGDSGSSL